jgi:hypothetical protein
VDRAGYQTSLFKVTSEAGPKQSAIQIFTKHKSAASKHVYTNTHFDPEDGDNIAHIHTVKKTQQK